MLIGVWGASILLSHAPIHMGWYAASPVPTQGAAGGPQPTVTSLLPHQTSFPLHGDVTMHFRITGDVGYDVTTSSNVLEASTAYDVIRSIAVGGGGNECMFEVSLIPILEYLKLLYVDLL